MSNHIANKIEAKDKNLSKVLNDERFKIDVFQREYRWQRKHIEDLVSDLSIAFLTNYVDGHDTSMYSSYDSYYMGPIVLCEDNGSLSIVDGQQRLTSFTLLLLYLNNLQKSLNPDGGQFKDLKPYIYVSKGGKTTLILDIDTREDIIKHFYNNSEIPFGGDSDDESVRNIIERYEDIKTLFPDEIKQVKVLPVFIEWLLYKVVMVEVKAFSMANAYTIFETMNDRGMNLSPTEMLKGYLLSKVGDEEKSAELNELWKQRISEIRRDVGPEGDLEFFRAWLRAKYADTIRPSKQGATNEDFELIGTQFHAWIRNNSPKKTNLDSSDDYYFFLRSDFDYYALMYNHIYSLRQSCFTGYEEVYISNFFTIADSLAYPLYLAPLTKIDDDSMVEMKIKLVCKFIDVFTNSRTILGKTITQSSIRYSMYELVKSIRNTDLESLKMKLATELQKSFDNSSSFLTVMQQMDNWNYYHYYFARLLYAIKYQSDDSDSDSLEEEVDFKEFMRSKRQKSLILVRIFNEEEIETGSEEFTWGLLINSVAGHCLIRRDDNDAVFSVEANDRISYLLSQGYLPEMAGFEYPVQNRISGFVTEREKRLRLLTDEIWEFN